MVTLEAVDKGVRVEVAEEGARWFLISYLGRLVKRRPQWFYGDMTPEEAVTAACHYADWCHRKVLDAEHAVSLAEQSVADLLRRAEALREVEGMFTAGAGTGRLTAGGEDE